MKSALMTLMRRRRPPPPKARAQAEAEILERGRWSQLRANEKFHSVEENAAARERCRQLLTGAVGAVNWVELYGQKLHSLVWGMRLRHPFSDGFLPLTNNYCAQLCQVFKTDLWDYWGK